ncbi:MAG: hypothetical protein EA408_02165 [Marinilabiliales bacterium]|nr:MAG: hypothetical protein EA408_02165 [Marinilabiliales bacterium]
MAKYILIAVLIILPCTLIDAQQPQRRGRADFEQVEAERIAFLTRYLELTSDEAKEFWPVYDDYRNRRELLAQERQSAAWYFNQNWRNLEVDEIEEIADKFISLQVKEAKLSEEYHEKFKSVLPAVKVMRLYEAENMFRMQLLRRVRGAGTGAPGRGQGGPPQ